MGKKNEIDLTGQRFGRLTVLEEGESKVIPSGKKCRRWICQCDCGNKTLSWQADLKRGRVLSCGCYQKEKVAENGRASKKYNTYDLSGEYGIGYTSKGEEFYFDLEDYDLIKDYCWHINRNGYIVNKTEKLIQMHRLVMKAKNGEIIDHKNGKTVDNRKTNLRKCTQSENLMNTKIRKDNILGVKGIQKHRSGKYSVRIGVNKKSIYP